MTKAIEKTELPFLKTRSSYISPHVLRHSFAIISHMSSVDIYDIMRSLGHARIETTMIYLEKVFEKERHAINEWKPEIFAPRGNLKIIAFIIFTFCLIKFLFFKFLPYFLFDFPTKN